MTPEDGRIIPAPATHARSRLKLIDCDVHHALLPLTLATGTTAIGLATLAVSELVPIRMFGIFSAAGVVVTAEDGHYDRCHGSAARRGSSHSRHRRPASRRTALPPSPPLRRRNPPAPSPPAVPSCATCSRHLSAGP
jgi:hypothetical protein